MRCCCAVRRAVLVLQPLTSETDVEPLVCEYLRSHSLSQLAAEHGVVTNAKPGDVLFSLNYDQIASVASPLTNQCRGLVLCRTMARGLTEGMIAGDAAVGSTQVMARPFDRFFNHGDTNAAAIDFADKGTRFFEKLDGTLCIVYFAGEWLVATRAVPTANRPINGWEDYTFRTLFEKAVLDTTGLTLGEWSKSLDQRLTYCFELTTPLNRIVVRYDDYKIHLLGARYTESGEEIVVDERTANAPVCPQHKLSNLSELIDFVGSKPPMEQEGVVVVDSAFRRVKVKSLAYLAYNKLRDSTADSPRAVMELILSEKLDDVFPVLEKHVQERSVKLASGIRALLERTEHDWIACSEAAKAMPDNPRKAFAVEAQRRKAWLPALMERYSGRAATAKEFIDARRDKKTGTWPNSFLDALIEYAAKL